MNLASEDPFGVGYTGVEELGGEDRVVRGEGVNLGQKLKTKLWGLGFRE